MDDVLQRNERALLRERVDLNDAEPPIWRQLEVRADITLATLHAVLQATFGWEDYHLHRFSVSGGPFDADATWFLCEFDVHEGDDEGTPDADVRLDSVLKTPGDVLHYVYDYGDHWDLRIVLEQLVAAVAEAPVARCIDGRRAAPPEDCGSRRTALELAEVLPDPAAFDIDSVNGSLLDPFVGLANLGLRRDLVVLLNKLRSTPLGDDAVTHAALAMRGQVSSPQERATALYPILWLLDRVGSDGLALTSADYLRPEDVEVAATVIPSAMHWRGSRRRESQTIPVLYFRVALQQVGLLRKAKGRLLLTKAGAAALQEPERLWAHLAQRLPLGKEGTFELQAGLMLLLYGGPGQRAANPYDATACALTALAGATAGAVRSRSTTCRTRSDRRTRSSPAWPPVRAANTNPPTRT